MVDAQDKGAADSTATDDAGANTGQDAPNTDKADKKEEKKVETITVAEAQRETDRRVTEALKKSQAEQESILANSSKDADGKLEELKAKNKEELGKLSAKAEEAEQYTDFLESATEAGIRNTKAAYLVAKGGGYIKRGRFQLAQFKEDNPEFFTTKPVNANAGDGAGQQQAGGQTMDDLIRSGARRGQFQHQP